MTPIPPIALELAKKGIVTILVPAVIKEAEKYWSKDHGSKVKDGAYEESSIQIVGNKACILVDVAHGEVVFLTSDEIESCKFIKEKFRLNRGKKYYYYEILFTDGKVCQIRVSDLIREAMSEYGITV